MPNPGESSNVKFAGSSDAAVYPDAAEPFPSLLHEVCGAYPGQCRQVLANRTRQRGGRSIPVAVRSPDRLRQHAVDDSQRQQVGRRQAKRLGRPDAGFAVTALDTSIVLTAGRLSMTSANGICAGTGGSTATTFIFEAR